MDNTFGNTEYFGGGSPNCEPCNQLRCDILLDKLINLYSVEILRESFHNPTLPEYHPLFPPFLHDVVGHIPHR